MLLNRNMDYKARNLGDTKGLDEKTWLKWRDHGPYYSHPESEYYVQHAIGGSDVSTVFDVNPWKSSLELYHQKIGVFPSIKREYNEEAKKVGHIFEPFVAQMFIRYMTEKEKIKNVEFIQDTNMYQCGELMYDKFGYEILDENGVPELRYPFALANLDGLCKVHGKLGIFEAKTTTSRNYEAIVDWKNGIVPRYYELQCRYYMAIANRDFCYITCCWGFHIDEMAVILIERDLSIEETIMETVKEFVVNHISKKVEPDLLNCKSDLINEYYSRLYGEVDEKAPMIELSDKYAKTIFQAIKIDEDIKSKTLALNNAVLKREEIYKSLYPVFGKSSKGSYKLNEEEIVYITLKTPYKRQVIDIKKLETELPDVYEKYVIPTFDKETFSKKEKKLALEFKAKKEVSNEPGRKNSFELKIKKLIAK